MSPEGIVNANPLSLKVDAHGIPVTLHCNKTTHRHTFSEEEAQDYLKLYSTKLNEFKPDIVIGTGGFVTGPVLLNASLMKYKTYFHEQNSYPGVTNKILSRFVNKYFVTFEESIKYANINDC